MHFLPSTPSFLPSIPSLPLPVRISKRDAKVSLYYHPQPAALPSKVTNGDARLENGTGTGEKNGGGDNDEAKGRFSAEGMTMKDLVEERCPSLAKGEYWPTRWLANGHLQTIYSAFQPQNHVDIIRYTRQNLAIPDGGQIAVDITPPLPKGFATSDAIPKQESYGDEVVTPSLDTPILVCLHGLSGGSYEAYVRNVLAIATRPKEDGGLGWRGIVINARGCGGSELTSPQLFHGGWTHDLRCALLYIARTFPNALLCGAGFSLGANILSKYLGEEGSKGKGSGFVGAAVLGNPWNFWLGHLDLMSYSMGRVYSRAMASNVRNVVANHKAAFEGTGRLDWDAVYRDGKKQTLGEFDELVTAHLGGFPNLETYYKTQSSTKFISSLKTPLLAVNAIDDPIASSQALPFASNLDRDALTSPLQGKIEDTTPASPYLVIATTKYGGHLGWWHADRGRYFVDRDPRRWVAGPVTEWLEAIIENASNAEVKTHEGIEWVESESESDSKDGWIWAKGNEKGGEGCGEEIGGDRQGKRRVGYRLVVEKSGKEIQGKPKMNPDGDDDGLIGGL